MALANCKESFADKIRQSSPQKKKKLKKSSQAAIVVIFGRKQQLSAKIIKFSMKENCAALIFQVEVEIL